jgi:hypothetical protein
MDKLDHLGWVAGLCVEANGIGLGVRTNTQEVAVLNDLERLLPPGATPRLDPSVDVLYSVVRGKSRAGGQRNFHLLYMNSTRVVRTMEWLELQERLLLGARVIVTQSMRRHIFVAAAAVSWGERAILILGLGQIARLELVQALVSAGCKYMSTEYALISKEGALVSPFPNLVPLRPALGEAGTYRLPAELAWPEETRTLPIGSVVVATHTPADSWRQRRITRGRGLLALMSAAIAARREPETIVRVFDRALANATLLEVRFGHSGDAAERLLNTIGAQAT